VAAAASSSSTAFVWGLKPATLSETARVVSEWVTVQDVANLVMAYMFAPTRFGAAEWSLWFGVAVEKEPKSTREMTLFWNQQGVSDSHLPPVLCPQFIDGKPFTLKLLGQLVKKPKNEGHNSKYKFQSLALDQHQNRPAGPACWLVMKKDVGALDQPYAEQIAWIQSLPGSYEARISAIHLATVIFTRHVISGERHLGNRVGLEWRSGFARCQELVRYGADSYPLEIGSSASNGLTVNYSQSISDTCTCAVALRKF